MRTVDRFLEAQEQLLRFLVNSIIRIAEAASLFKGKDARQQLVDHPRRHWIKKAMNEWNSDMELEKAYSGCDRSVCSPGLQERRQCQLVMDVADQEFSAQSPNISIAPWVGGTCELSWNIQDDPWPFCQDQQVSSVLEIVPPQIIADNGREYDPFDFQGDNPGLEPSVSQSLDSSQPHPEHTLRSHPAMASICEVYQDEPPAFTSASTDRIWPGIWYNHGDPSKTLQPSSIENLFSPQIFMPLPSVAFDSSSSYDYNFQPSGSRTISSLHGSPRLTQSPCPSGSVVTHTYFPEMSSSWPTKQYHPIAHSDLDLSTIGSMSLVNEIPYLPPTFPTEFPDCGFRNAFHCCLHEHIPDADVGKRGPHPSASCCFVSAPYSTECIGCRDCQVLCQHTSTSSRCDWSSWDLLLATDTAPG